MNRGLFAVLLVMLVSSFAFAETEVTEIKSPVISDLSVGYEFRNFKISSALEEEGIIIEPSSFSVVSAQVSLFADKIPVTLGYRTAFDNTEEPSGIGTSENSAFEVFDVSMKPFAVLGFKNIELGYSRYKHHTYFEVEDTGFAAGGEYYLFNNGTRTVTNLNIGDKGQFKIDISRYFLNIYFGKGSSPLPLFLGMEYADTQRPMTTNADFEGLSHREIRFDEEFKETSLKLGWKPHDMSKEGNGFFIKEANVFYSDVDTSSKYKELSKTKAEIESSYGAYFEPAVKFRAGLFGFKEKAEILFSVFLSEQDTISSVEHSDEMIFWYGANFSLYQRF